MQMQSCYLLPCFDLKLVVYLNLPSSRDGHTSTTLCQHVSFVSCFGASFGRLSGQVRKKPAMLAIIAVMPYLIINLVSSLKYMLIEYVVGSTLVCNFKYSQRQDWAHGPAFIARKAQANWIHWRPSTVGQLYIEVGHDSLLDSERGITIDLFDLS